jgi:hypothetical protein
LLLLLAGHFFNKKRRQNMDFRNFHIRPIIIGALIALFVIMAQAADQSVAANQDWQQDPLLYIEPTLVLPPGERQINAAVNCTDTTCPAAPTGLDKCVERTKYCVYYTTASISQTQADWAADIVQYYWDRFVALGFGEPKYSGKLEVQLSNTTDCNGGSDWSVNYITTYAGCFSNTTNAQRVLGHELTHRLQYAHDTAPGAPNSTKFMREGTARATEDNWFSEIDNWADALSYSSFNPEANAYLLDTELDITSYDMRYKSCLWWKYATEQYGIDPDEPELGIDFIQEVYDQVSLGYSGISAVNHALSAYGAGTNFNQSFKRFGAAIWTKDLTGVPDDSYNFIDEEQVGNPAVYGPIAPEEGGTIQIGTSATWVNRSINKYSLRYYRANIGAVCPVVSASFHRDDAGPAFYHVITQNGTVFNTHVEGSGVDWTQSFLNDGITSIVAVVGSLENSSQVDITLSCADPVLDIKMPNSVAVARVQPSTKFLAQVLVTNGSVSGPVVAGLENSNFTAQVGGADAEVVGGGFIQEQYWLLIQAPDSLTDGTYDLEITLADPDTGTPMASDTSADSVLYSLELTDQVLVIDRSGSMGTGSPTRLSAAQHAATFYVDVTRDGEGLAVVPYNQDVNPAPFAISTVDDTVRTDARTYIDGLPAAAGTTSIGDGMAEALKQIEGSPTENDLCSFVLLSDGMENTELYWADVRGDVIASGCPVTTIAFGPESDETLLQSIASDTGGLYFYNDVYVSSPTGVNLITQADMALDLGNTYEYAQARAEDRQRLLSEKGSISAKDVEITHHVLVDETVSEAVFSLDWYETYDAFLELWLVDPDGNEHDPRSYSFNDTINHHVGFRIEKPVPGIWQLKVVHKGSEEPYVPYQVIVSGRSQISLELLLPDRLGLQYQTGNQIPIYAILSGHMLMEPGPVVTATLTMPNGMEGELPLFDDGQHGDGFVNDGLYGGVFTQGNQAQAVSPTGEEGQTEPNDEGSYRVVARAVHEKFVRQAMGSFSILEGPDDNQNRIPDSWEKEYNLADPDPQGDPDLDLLVNYDEYMHGTDPLDPDSDDGGEKDGSEVSGGRNPLNPADDLIRRPDFLLVRPWMNAAVLQFDRNPAYSFIRLFRKLGMDGAWSQVFSDIGLPPTGHYTDTKLTNGLTYYYRLEGVIIPVILADETSAGSVDAIEIVSDMLISEGVTPSADPILPEAHVVINLGAMYTHSRDVSLTFEPYEEEGEDIDAFSDITQVMLSNSPDFSGATWQAFQQGIPWQLDVAPYQEAQVYARFKDSSSNESIGTEFDTIFFNPPLLMPIVIRE